MMPTSPRPSDDSKQHQSSSEELLSLLNNEAYRHIISTADYTDRRRLLYHITYLSTQLQRATLLLQQYHNNNASGFEAEGNTETHRINNNNNNSIEEEGACFDPVVAQTQIHRLDDAVAALSLLRDVELQQLRRCEEQLCAVEEKNSNLMQIINTMNEEKNQLAEMNASLQNELMASRITVSRFENEIEELKNEVTALRREEVYLNKKIFSLEEFNGEENRECAPMEIRQGNGNGIVNYTNSNNNNNTLLRIMEGEEEVKRVCLLQEMFWEPMSMAMDAGLTWLSALEENSHNKTSANAFIDEENVKLKEEVVEMAKRHAEELKTAYQILGEERNYILNSISYEMDTQVKKAFLDGRAYEREKFKIRKSAAGLTPTVVTASSNANNNNTSNNMKGNHSTSSHKRRKDELKK